MNRPDHRPNRRPRHRKPGHGPAAAQGQHGNPATQKLHKILAQSGVGSRRDMEALIAAGKVIVNGAPATVATRINPGDEVLVNGNNIKLQFNDSSPRVLIYYKPEGEIVSRDDPEGRPTVFDRLPKVRNGRWVAVGRLDINTSGLLLLTTHGELANRLMHPRYEVEREYAVRTMGRLTDDQLDQLTTGVMMEDGEALLNTIEDRGGGEGINHWYHVTLKEGRNREVRRLFESVGSTISRLIRVRFGTIELPPHLKRGQTKEMDEQQVAALLTSTGLPVRGQRRPGGPRDQRPGPGGPRPGVRPGAGPGHGRPSGHRGGARKPDRRRRSPPAK